MKKRVSTIGGTIVAILGSATALADVPYTFVAGQQIRASEINANFAALETALAKSRPDLVRATVTAASDVETLLFTVPTNSARQYVLKSVLLAPSASISCVIAIAGATITAAATTYQLDVSVPVQPGESITVKCGRQISNGAILNVPVTAVFEK